MPNHFHLLLEVQESPSARIMQSLLTVTFGGLIELTGKRDIFFEGELRGIATDSTTVVLLNGLMA